MVDRLRLRLTDPGKYVEFETDLPTICNQIVTDDAESLAPDVLVLHGSSWVTLKDYQEAPWLDELARRAVDALKSNETETCQGLCNRVLRFAGNRQSEAVFIALLLVGHLRFIEGRLQDAISCWELTARSRSPVRAVACSNLGTAWARARNPVSAMECLDRAIAIGPGFLLPHLSRRNLAETLIKEGAPCLPGRKTWNTIYRESSERIGHTGKKQIRQLMREDRPFPTYHVMHAFAPGPYCPAISSQLTCPDVKTLGARSVLDAAACAFREGEYELALKLARRAGKMSAAVKPAADSLAAAAGAKARELECLREASRYVETVTGFFQALREMDTDRDAPREFLPLLEAVEGDVGDFRQLYTARMLDLTERQLRKTSEEAERTWLLMVASLFQSKAMSGAYVRASRIRLGSRYLKDFWNACERRDSQSASLALRQAEQQTGTTLEDLRRVLKCLQYVYLDRDTEVSKQGEVNRPVGDDVATGKVGG